MRKAKILSLLALMTIVVTVNAQKKPSALETYAKWRGETVEKYPGGAMTPHYSVAAVTQRLDAKSARIQFAVVGKMAGFTMEIQPVNIGTQQKLAGEKTISRIRGISERPEINPISETEVIISVDNSANAIEVKWTPEGVTEEMSYTLVLPVESEPSANVFGVIPPRKK